MLWPPIKKFWNDIEDNLKKSFNLVFSKEINLKTESDFEKLIYDIYFFETGIEISNIIINKANILKSYDLSLKFIIVEDKINSMTNLSFYEKVLLAKEEMRNKYVKKTFDKYSIIHSSDNKEHSNYLLNLIISNNTYKYINFRNKELRKEFKNWLKEFLHILSENNINNFETCIVGSSSMELLNIRNSTDIDFIVKSIIRKNNFDNNITKLSRNVDLVNKGYLTIANCEISDNEVIDDIRFHIYFRGIKFITIDQVYNRKKWQKRPKDLDDCDLIESFFEELDKNHAYKKENFLFKKIRYFYYFIVYKVRRGIIKLLPKKLKRFLKKKLQK